MIQRPDGAGMRLISGEWGKRSTAQLALLIVLISWIAGAAGKVGQPAAEAGENKTDPSAIEFFEQSVRPILVERCQGCHGPAKQKGGLRLDSRQGALAGGLTGPAVVPGQPERSLLIDAVNYGELYQMPPKSKLPPEEIVILTRWVKQGPAWGIDSSTKSQTAAAATSKPGAQPGLDTPGEFQRRAKWWCFQPIARTDPPMVSERHASWPRNTIDRFVMAAMERQGLSPAPEADRRTLIRRLTFDLKGLPPEPAEVAAFLADTSADAYGRLVDRLLASPRYGERWARHWLDLVRFAETAGHEYDYETPSAFRYRDFVIRALNADVPYQQFVMEQVAGDLLTSPRRHPTQGFNESIIGTGFYFLGEGTHSPVDVREDELRRIDNQIDVFSKTFLGLTVACARCHDHKFDPITSRDYYALAGFLRSSRHQQAFIDPPDRIAARASRLNALKQAVRAVLLEARPLLPEPMRRAVIDALEPALTPRADREGAVFESFDRDAFDGWTVSGDAFGDHPTRAGDFRLSHGQGKAWLIPVRPGLAHSGLVAGKLAGVMRSRTFTIESRFVHWLVAGKGARLNVVIDGYEKIRDPIYGGLTVTVDAGDQARWITQDVGMWLGHRAYLEIADGATADYNGAQTRLTDGHGFVAIDEIRMSDQSTPGSAGRPQPAPIELEPMLCVLQARSKPLADRLKAALVEYQSIEAAIPDPTLSLAIADGTGEDEAILTRGNHRNPGALVPRRFLEVLGGAEQATVAEGSGRLELARHMVDPRANPLLPRVLVNRLWQHHFGEGLVRTVDDFGVMGQKPSHPELLDWLAGEFIAGGWSMKAMHRLMVTSSSYRMSSALRAGADRLDPANVFLHRMNVRRLEAETIRDALLAVSGRLDPAMFGPSVPSYLSPFMDGRGRPEHSGPLDGDGRRSIYLSVRRNFLSPMFLAFDAPVPFSTMGRRNVSNVPAQALTLMNDPLMSHLARRWADRLLAGPQESDRDRIIRLFETAFNRPPADDEAGRCLAFLKSRPAASHDSADPAAWVDLCHVLFNVKEFIYID